MRNGCSPSLRAAPRAHEAGYAKETIELLRSVLPGTLPSYRELVRVLAEGLKRRARERPLAVILDDADRADGAFHLFVIVAERAAGERERGGPDGGADGAVEDKLTDGHAGDSSRQ